MVQIHKHMQIGIVIIIHLADIQIHHIPVLIQRHAVYAVYLPGIRHSPAGQINLPCLRICAHSAPQNDLIRAQALPEILLPCTVQMGNSHGAV